jgi:Zn-dependent protease
MEIAIPLIILIFSIIVHEVAHGWAADALGDPTARYAGRLTLNPIPHIDLMGSILIPGLLILTHSPIFFGWAKPVPYNPYNLKGRFSETMVALAGVATNLGIALIFVLVLRFGAEMLSPTALMVAGTIIFVNLFLGLFNLLPFPPLDGWSALRSALPWHLSRGMEQFERQMAGAGAVSLILFLLVFSFVLARPFAQFVSYIFTFLTGVGV